MKPTENGVAGEAPVLDFTKLMNQFQLPGVDFTALVDVERKNIEALVKANRIAFEGWQRLRSSASRNAPGNRSRKWLPMLVRKTPQKGRISQRGFRKGLGQHARTSGDDLQISERGLRRGSQEDRGEHGRHPKSKRNRQVNWICSQTASIPRWRANAWAFQHRDYARSIQPRIARNAGRCRRAR